MFVSTDGAWIGFQGGQPAGVDAVLRKAQVDGGASTLLTPIDANLRGGTWVGDDSIVFATASRTSGLFRVPSAGGTAEMLTKASAADGELDHLWPSALPDGKHVLFSIMRTTGGFDVALLSLDTKTWRVLLKDGFSPRYIPTGHVVYASGSSIRAVPFDLATLEIRGDSVEVQAGVVTKDSGAADFAVGGNGTLVYLLGDSIASTQALVWVEPGPDGKETPIHVPPANYLGLRVSPDGALAVAGLTQANAPQTLALIDLAHETSVRLTPVGMLASAPVWSRDGKEIVFAVTASPERSEAAGLFRVAVTGAAVPVRLTTAPDGLRHVPGAWTTDGRIIFTEGSGNRRDEDIKVLTPGSPPVVTTLVAGPAAELNPSLSPDGRWLAYVEVEGSVTANVFVRPFPNVNDAKIPVSVGTGTAPAWGPDGHELYFRADNAHVMVVPVEKTQPLTFGKPKPFPVGKEGRFTQALPPVKGRVLRAVSAEAASNAPTEYRVVLNWTSEVVARVKAKK